MALTKSRGNMYPFVTHTWNAIKGICFHDCPYCYMKKFDGLLPIRFDPKELEVTWVTAILFSLVAERMPGLSIYLRTGLPGSWIIVTCLITTIFSSPRTLHVFWSSWVIR